MLRQATDVELITHEHRFTAKIYTQGRLLDTLNDRSTDYLHINAVDVYRYGDPDERIAACQEAIIRKDDLHLVIVTSEEHEAPTHRLFSYVQKIPYHVFLTVPGYEVRGTLYLTQQRDPDPIVTLESHTSRFFPVTGATASQAWTGEDVLSAPVVMVNKSSMSLFYLDEKPVE